MSCQDSASGRGEVLAALGEEAREDFLFDEGEGCGETFRGVGAADAAFDGGGVADGAEELVRGHGGEERGVHGA